MVRSLGLVLAIVFVIYLLAGTPKSNEKSIRVIDPSADVSAFAEVAPGVPVPGLLPGWRATVSDYTRAGKVLRVGWVTPAGEYAEYAATTTPTADFLREMTDDAAAQGTVDVGGVRWARYVKGDEISLVRSVAGAMVIVGTRRESTTFDELRVLAAALR